MSDFGTNDPHMGATAAAPMPAPPQPSWNVPASPAWNRMEATSYADAGLTMVGRLVLAAILDAILYLVTFGIGWLVWATITAANGQTPAKSLMHMRVVDATTGVPLTWGRYIFMRGLLGGIVQGFATSLTLGVLWLMPLWDRCNQTVAAKVSNSVVVDL